MPSADPFYLVKDDLENSLREAKGHLAQWQTLARGSRERTELQKTIELECGNIASSLNEVRKSVDVAEANPQRFRLTQQEIASRRKWVQATQQQGEEAIRALHAPEQATRSMDNGSATDRLSRAQNHENDQHIADEQEQQQMLIRQQDDSLDLLGQGVNRIGQMGLQMRDELSLQDRMLEDLDTDMEGTHSRLQAAQKKVDHLLRKAGLKGQFCIIAFLIVVLIILLLMLFS
ncbi:hypothetical protein WJX73_009954 [Symbiochloris irregularis]|uniref:t-SNARE coiled-coil homology domain-containing protein n=1 Tax=Symbiochloris irregularis TaxID=706552 RepID=A0AAW1P2Y3_9CHLO